MPKSTIPLTPCESRQLAAFGYDPATKTLAIAFRQKNGVSHPYHYPNVSQEKFDAFCCAESKGHHFNTTFKNNAEHPFTKMVPDEDEADAA